GRGARRGVRAPPRSSGAREARPSGGSVRSRFHPARGGSGRTRRPGRSARFGTLGEHTSCMSDLFSDAARQRLPEVAPLAMRLRPKTLEEFVGQRHVLGPRSALRLAIAEDRVGSMVLHGPPGSGKTTLARVVANVTGADFEELSAVSASVSDVRATI